MTSPTREQRAAGGAVLADLVAIVVFVAIGRNNHDEGGAFGDVARVAAPFLLAMLAGWLVAHRFDGKPFTVRFGAIVWATTVVIGMLVRRTVFNRGTALPFVIVATVFLGFTLIGWRAVARLLLRKRPS